MIILINYFNGQARIFDNITYINDINNEDYILTDTFKNEIRIPKLNVEYILIDKNYESKQMSFKNRISQSK